jgi:hypothetical protein
MWKRVIWLLPAIFMIIYLFLPKDDRFFLNFDGNNLSEKAFLGESFADFQKQHSENLNLALYQELLNKIPPSKEDMSIIEDLKDYHWNEEDLVREQKFYRDIPNLKTLIEHKYQTARELIEILQFKDHRFVFFLHPKKKIEFPKVDAPLWQGDIKKLPRRFLLVTRKGENTSLYQELYYRIRSFMAPYARTAWLQTEDADLIPKEQKFQIYSDYSIYPGLDVDMAQIRLFLLDAYIESLKAITQSR